MSIRFFVIHSSSVDVVVVVVCGISTAGIIPVCPDLSGLQLLDVVLQDSY